ncbi:MAG: hypothetical protein O2958_13640 [Gemmatimonadetes bacterium]|nr:hypothetical protein [Gemmatimonadota bacterium]MDA1102953.1 hypothetical protein [Gemmatimonadota bacterium]
MVMAHGGTPEWNRHVADAVAPLAREVPTAVAYGMADPATLRAALDSLRARGVQRVAVVRMFLSGESFLEQTQYYLGLSETPPDHFIHMSHGGGVHETTTTPILHGMEVATHFDGLLTSGEAGMISVQRVAELSSDPAQESVLLVAHGMGDEGENQRVLAAMRSAADLIRTREFARVEIATLREDWAAERVIAEADMRAFVRGETAEGRRVLVIPMRLAGFGPYAEVLAGLEYQAGDGLLPHPGISDWLRATSIRVTCSAEWGSPMEACPR